LLIAGENSPYHQQSTPNLNRLCRANRRTWMYNGLPVPYLIP
jgi:hypothetical protein